MTKLITPRIVMASLFASALGFASPVVAQQATGLNLSSDQPVQIDGDSLEVLEDQGLAIFKGNVKVVQGKTVLQTGELVIHYAKNADGTPGTGGSDIEKLEASGGVNIQSGKQVATGDVGTYDMKSEVLVLSGKRVTLSEDGNVATGCKLTVTMSNSRAKLEGCGNSGTRPTVLIQPKNASN